MKRLSHSVLALFTFACSGTISDVSDGPSEQHSVQEPVPSTWNPGQQDDPNAAGPMPLRRLTAEEYRNVVRDLFGVESDFALPADVTGSSGFATPGLASLVDVQNYQLAAERIANEVSVDRLLTCDGSDEQQCVGTFIRDFGQRAFRRPLTSAEVEQFEAHDRRLAADWSFKDRIRAILEAMLQAPGFLYRWELGPRPPTLGADGAIALDAWERASRLSFFLWRSAPDEPLIAAAQSGRLSDAAGLEEQARRMLADARAQDSISSFFREWLEIPDSFGAKSPDLYPDFDETTERDMLGELSMLSSALTLEPGDSVLRLFTTNEGYTSDSLGSIYGSGTGETLGVTALDAATRPGLLTRAAFLAATSNAIEGDPTKRGVVIRKKVLCQQLAAPPANVPPLPAPEPGLSVRERHEQHMVDPACNGCHQLTDPIGFGLSNFDAVGAYHTELEGTAVDATGQVASVDGQHQPFNDVSGLMQILASSEEVQRCLVRQWMRYAYGRVESDADGYALSQAYSRFTDANRNFGELLVALTTSRSFLFRAPSEQEVVQ